MVKEAELKSLISSKFNIPENTITPEISFRDLGFDSLGMHEFFIWLEDQLDVDISDEEADKMKKIGDLFNWLDKR